MNEPEPALAITDDRLLDGRVQLMQPQEGYRVAIDPVFLAAAVPAGPGDLVLDVGAGVGAAALCLAWREQACQVRGIEVQRDLVRLAAPTIDLKGSAARAGVWSGALLRPRPRLAPSSSPPVMPNPPFLPREAATAPPQRGRATAHVEGEADLADWVRFCLTMA